MPPPLRTVRSCQMLLLIVNVADRGRRQLHKGIWDVVVHMVEEEEVGAVVLVCQIPIHPRVDDWGKRSGVMLVGLPGSHTRLGKEEEEALRCNYDSNKNGGYRGRGGRGERKRGKGLLSGLCHGRYLTRGDS